MDYEFKQKKVSEDYIFQKEKQVLRLVKTPSYSRPFLACMITF